MKKILFYSLILISIFTLSFARVEAKVIDVRHSFDNTNSVDPLQGQGNYANCNGLLTHDAVEMIREILGYFRILGPIALIVFTALDFGQAVISQDNDALKKAQSKVTMRAIGTALLFFVPTIIRAILGLDGVREAIEIPDDPLCQTMNSNIVENIETI